MNTTYFIKKLRYLIEAQQPFIAYWHNHGYCILRTGEVVMQLPDGRGGRKLTTCRASAASVKKLRRMIEKMRAGRQGRLPPAAAGQNTNPGTIDSSSRILRGRKSCGSLTVVEYDGMNLDAEGNPEIVEVLI